MSTIQFLLFGRPQRAHPDQDPADMGTCFGLEMSLDDPQIGAEPAAAKTTPAHSHGRDGAATVRRQRRMS